MIKGFVGQRVALVLLVSAGGQGYLCWPVLAGGLSGARGEGNMNERLCCDPIYDEGGLH